MSEFSDVTISGCLTVQGVRVPAPVVVTPAVDVRDEGVPIANNPHTTLNFVGAGVTAVDAGAGVATITIPVGGVLAFGSNNALANGDFLSAWSGNAHGTEVVDAKIIIPGAAGELRTLKYARGLVTNAPGGITADNFTVRVNGVATAIVASIVGAAKTGADLVTAVVVTAGDTVTVQFTKTGAPAPTGQTMFSVGVY